MLAASIPSRSLRSNNANSLSVPRVKTNTGARGFTLVPHLFGTTCRCLSVQPFQLLPSRNVWRHTSLWLGLSPVDTGMPDGLLMLRNCFLEFAIKHWFGCRTTEPGFAEDIGAIEIWLTDWLIDPPTPPNLYGSTSSTVTQFVQSDHFWMNCLHILSKSQWRLVI